MPTPNVKLPQQAIAEADARAKTLIHLIEQRIVKV